MPRRPWYPWFPGDFGRDTAHLSLAQVGAYRLLLDHYYSSGSPLPNDHETLYRICKAVASEERKAVDSVLKQFFQESKDGLRNGRADREIKRQGEIEANLSLRGRHGAERRWTKKDATSIEKPMQQAMPQAMHQASAKQCLRDGMPQPQPQTTKNSTTAPHQSKGSHERTREIPVRTSRISGAFHSKDPDKYKGLG